MELAEPSPFFTLLAFSLSLCILLAGLIWGWINGMWRVVGLFGAVAGAALAAWYLSPGLQEGLESRFGWEGDWLLPTARALIAAPVFFLLSILSRLILPSTGRVNGAWASVIVGLGGGLLGLLLTALIQIGMVWGLRHAEPFAQAYLETLSSENGSPPSGFFTRLSAGVLQLNEISRPLDQFLPSRGEPEAEGSESLPDPTTKILTVGYTLASDPEKLQSFFERRDVQRMLRQPVMQNYLRSPGVMDAIENFRFDSLLFLPETRQLLQEPEIRRFVRDFSWE